MAKKVWVRACFVRGGDYRIFDHRSSHVPRWAYQSSIHSGVATVTTYIFPHTKVLVDEADIPRSSKDRRAGKWLLRRRSREIRRAWTLLQETSDGPVKSDSAWPQSHTKQWMPSVTWAGPGVDSWQ